eukprot:CAMPEP_0197482214 /NCGR_PEP_ID=MMETSP1309-20131121/52907_1 /TAXON_ID=464262 /ORGANISM="Genus nov. species nov., Strain RCC998" /LENGTH=81 /DNA_ID=CAMNT_0043024659 /DNA_START=303 /DNA_END=548 /DNA_ORIENTATION=+
MDSGKPRDAALSACSSVMYPAESILCSTDALARSAPSGFLKGLRCSGAGKIPASSAASPSLSSEGFFLKYTADAPAMPHNP